VDAAMNDTPPQPPENQTAAAKALPWADLAADQLRLLRLAPLPTDRLSGPRPLRFVQLGRLERHNREQSLLRLTLQLPNQVVHSGHNRLEIWADHQRKVVHLGSDDLQVEPQNRGLGRFLLAQGIAWARQRWSHYKVAAGALPLKDALNDELRQRRDHFLRSLGIDVQYPDALQLKASYAEAQVGDLLGDWNQEKVQIVELIDAAAMLQQADQNLREQDVQLRKQEESINAMKREDGTLRFTVSCLAVFVVFQAGLLIWIATH
jgi:hypothetical protein